MTTQIEWCQETWNPVTGCTPISPGCTRCYAKRMAARLAGRYGYPKDDPFRVKFHESRLVEPLRWKKPRMVFVCSMGDLFHDDVDRRWLESILGVVEQCPRHKFLFLTKRAQNMRERLMNPFSQREPLHFNCGRPLANLWLGVTAV